MRISKFESITLIVAAALFLLLGIFNNYGEPRLNKSNYQKVVAKTYHRITAEVKADMADPNSFNWILHWVTKEDERLEDFEKLLGKAQQKPYSIAVVDQSSVKAWTDPSILVTPSILRAKEWMVSDDSIFSKTFTVGSSQGNQLTLVTQFKLPGKYISPSQFNEKEQAAPYPPILNEQGDPVAYPVFLTAPTELGSSGWKLSIYLLAYLAVLLGIGSLLRHNVGRWSFWQVLAVILIPVIFRALDVLLGIGAMIDQQLVNAGAVEKPFLSQVYGHFIMGLFLYFLAANYFLDSYKAGLHLLKTKYGHIKWSLLVFSIDFTGLIMILVFCREIVINSGIYFDFNNVFNLGTLPILSIVLLAICMFRYFLLSYKINQNLLKNKISFREKVYGVLGGFVIILPMLYFTQLQLPIYILLLVLLLLALLFDIFIEIKSPTLGWLVIWVIFFSAFATVALFKFNKDKEYYEKLSIIERLEHPDDTVLYHKFSNAVLHLKNTKSLHQLFNEALASGNADKGREAINMALSKEPYILDYYIVDFLVTNNDSVLVASRTGLRNTLRNLSPKWVEYPNFLIADNPDYFHSYLLKIYWQGSQFKPSPVVNFFVRKRTIVPSSSVAERGNFMQIENIDKYDYAIYQRGQLVESQGRMYPDIIDQEELLGNKTLKEINSKKRGELVSAVSKDTVIIVGKELMGIIKPISLFSMLFVLLILLAILLSLINSRINILPRQLPMFFSNRFNLRQRIEYSILLVILTSFGIIAWITSIYFRDLSFKMDENQITSKSYALVADIESQVQTEQFDSLRTGELAAISRSHQTEFSIFNLDGGHMYSTTGQFHRNNAALRMEPIAYYVMRRGGRPIYQQQSTDGNSIQKVFLPVKDIGQRKIAWIEVPSAANANLSFFGAADFLGTLFNVYVFLLLVAGGIAIAIANSITKPLVKLVEKLKQIKLGKKNEPLEWSNADEIGSLIREYNTMIVKLEESAELLARSEREGAWREMAQQVAHEIKNPLTPMKLSVQYLEKVVHTSDPENLVQSISNTAQTLIEQIDNLAAIATEFSNFAKMPAPVMEYHNLNDLVSSVYELFRKREDLTLSLKIPMDDLIILADKSHLIRVLNNLMQNAIQSVPPSRSGIINLELKASGPLAVLIVKDNGSGIQADMHEKVFYPNFTTKSSGMGLGLSMCKSIVESINGRIYFHTDVGNGTEFIVEIPLSSPVEPISNESRDEAT